MSKPETMGSQSLEEILASIRRTLGTAASDEPASEEPSADLATGPAPAQASPVVPAAGDDDLSDLLDTRRAPDLPDAGLGPDLFDTRPAPLAPHAADTDAGQAAPAAKGASESRDPLWFWPRRRAAPQDASSATQPGEPSSRPQPESKPDEIRLTRPEIIRASLPPLFGPEEPTVAVPSPNHTRSNDPAPIQHPGAAGSPALETQAPSAKTSNGAAAPNWNSASGVAAEPTASGLAPPSGAAPASPSEQAAAPPPFATPTAAAALESAGPFAGEAAAAARPPLFVTPAAVLTPEPAGPPASAEETDPTPANAHLGASAPAVASTQPGPEAPASADDESAAQARALEQAIAQLLEPVLRRWLETNLPRMVETVIRDEVARAIKAERDKV